MTSPRQPLRVLIVDDEPLARQRIIDLLAHENAVEIAGTADTGIAAIDAIKRLTPDLVFLDVQMPGMNGLDVVRAIGADDMPPTIFITAFDQHALQAFELAALDYLVKPFDDERFEQALRRARRFTALEDTGRLHEQLLSVLRGEASRPVTAPISDGAAAERRAYHRPHPGRVAWQGEVSSRRRRRLHHVERSVRGSCRRWAEALDPRSDARSRRTSSTRRTFTRIHRSTIVRLDRRGHVASAARAATTTGSTPGTARGCALSRSRRDALAASCSASGEAPSQTWRSVTWASWDF